VDDEELFLQSIQRILHKHSLTWRMDFVGNVEAALYELHRQSFDVVVTDIKMPGRDGFDLISTMKNDPSIRDIPIIVLTGSNEKYLKSQALKLGATDLLNKPIDSTELIARIQNTLNLKKYEDQIREQNKTLEERVKERTAELEDARLDILWRLAKAGELRDDDTGNHVVRVANYCRILANKMGLPQERVQMIYLTSPLHDIGKIGIPDRILLKRGELSPSQKEIMQRHCELGADILMNPPTMLLSFFERGKDVIYETKSQKNPLLNLAALTALTHHEWWDGSGYPQRLSRQEIPLESRIVAIADVYDALRSTRPYKPAYAPEQTMTIMRAEAKQHFDPQLFSIFEQSCDDFHFIWETGKDEG